MSITTSGFPKSGTHALAKACQLLGLPCRPQHIAFGTKVKGRHLFIKRDPRDVLVSWLRFVGQPVTPGMVITAFRQFQSRPLVEEMAEFSGWLDDPDTMVVRYENLIRDDAEMRRIAQHVGVPYLNGAWQALPGLTYSWRQPHSDWGPVWTPEVDAVWRAESGLELLRAWGY